MLSCTNCGASVVEWAQFCQGCGEKTATVDAEQVTRFFVALASTGQTIGPIEHDAIKALIDQQQVRLSDSIRAEGSDTWTPILQSPFASLVSQRANLDRLAASSCPRCGAAMAVVMRRSKVGLVLVIIGLLTTPLFGIGIPIFVVGFILRWGLKGKATYQCPRCNYATP